MQQKSQLGKPLPVFASVGTHINCGTQLLSLISCAHSTVAHLHYEYNYLPIIIHKVPTITISRFDNAKLKTLIPSDANKPVASGASHDTSILQWPHFTSVHGLPPHRNNWPVSTGWVLLRSPLLTAVQQHSHKCGYSKKVKHDEWRESHFVSVHWLATTPELHGHDKKGCRSVRQTGNFPVLTALSVPYALLLQDDSLSHFNCLSLSLSSSLSLSLAVFFGHTKAH